MIWFRLTMLEAYVLPGDVSSYYECSDFPFNINFVVEIVDPLTARFANFAIHAFLNNMPEGKVANWVVRVNPFFIYLAIQ